jgi:carbonic anhydrase/acetyltransferase-like protein (isoleucine patch superfamily)
MPVYELNGAVPEIAEHCWVAPDAVLIGKVRLMQGASIWFGAVLRGDNDWITIGPNSNVQDHSIIHADPGQPVTIGRGVTIGHRVIVHSATVGDDSLIGMGAILLNRARIGRHCLVGAGALVTEDKEFGDGKLILGAPAKAMRDLTAEQISGIEKSAVIYVANAGRYAAGLLERDPRA